MRISRVRIQNFRCLHDVEIAFDDVTTFIGPNGVGKSTVLRALDWFFNGGKAETLTDEDFTHGSSSDEIRIEVEFSSLTQLDHAELGNYAPPGASKFIAWKTRNGSGQIRMSANARSYPAFATVRSAGSKTEIRGAYSSLLTQRPELNLPPAGSAEAVDAAMRQWEAEHPGDLEDSPDELQTNFFGFNSQGKMSGIFDFVLVTADLRAAEEVTDSKSTIIGRVLERAVDRSSADDAIARLTDQVKTQQQDIYDANFKEQLEELSADLSKVVNSYSDGRSVLVQTGDIELKPPATKFTVRIRDQDLETSVQRQGHGFQRTLLISALQLLAQRGSVGEANGVICLAIEEPELFQHPVQAQAFASVLRSLAEDSTQQIQVSYATHSPYFLEATQFGQVRRLVRKNNDFGGSTVTVHASNPTSVKRRLAGFVREVVIDRQMDNVAISRLPAALFANAVLLVEGTTEFAVLHGVADREKVSALLTSGIVVASVGGKNNIFLPHAILTEFGIPCFTMFDGDNRCQERALADGKTEMQAGQIKMDHAATNRALLKYLGHGEEDFPRGVLQSNAAVLEDQLESLLIAHWPEWIAERDRAVSQGEVDPSKNALAYRFITRMASGEPPDVLTQSIKLTLGLVGS